MKCRPRLLINEQGKSVLSMTVDLTTNLCVVLFLPIFLLKAKYDDRITGSFDTKEYITTFFEVGQAYSM
jgi:hypothetical protein